MKQKLSQPNLWDCILFILLGVLYTGLLHFHIHMTGVHQFDGIVGVLIGLYICAQPAAHFLDMLLYHQYAQLRLQSRWTYGLWWALNVLVLIVGWNDIVSSLIRFSGG